MPIDLRPRRAGAGAAAAPDVSVVVPTHGRPDAIVRLLEGLARQTLPASRFEVLVTDDGTLPPVAPRLAALALPYRMQCEWQEQAGPGAARNRAIAKARAPLLLILNDDAGVPPDLLERHVTAHARSPSPRAWLGGFDFAPDCRTPFAVALTRLDLLFPFDQMRRDGGNPGNFFWTCNLSVPRRPVVDAGGFDPDFREAISEDVELGLRLARRGLGVWYLDGAACLHHHRLDVGAFVRRQVSLGRAMVQLWRKHRDPELLPWLRLVGGDATRLAASIELDLTRCGEEVVRKVDEIARLDRGVAVDGPPADHAAAVDAIAKLLPRVNGTALGLGILAGVRGLDTANALRWLAARLATPSNATPILETTSAS
jgi:GT2 family glycosyltransferase